MSAALAIQQPKLLVPNWEPEHVLVIDFETYWSVDYSLTKLGTSDYVRNPQFEVIGVGVGDGEEMVWFEREQFVEWAKTIDWSKTAVVAHHAHFEGLILSHHFNIHPAFFFCTLSMARTFGLQDGRGLDDLGEHFEVGTKFNRAAEDTKGKRRSDFTQAEWQRYGQYCLTDVGLTEAIFDAMLKAEDGYPESELWVIHEHVMMFTRPRLFLDVPLLIEYLRDEKARKQGLLDRVAKNKRLITSDKLFIAELEAAGLDSIPMKPSPKRKDPVTNEPLMIPAFSKDDPGMQELLEHESDPIRWLAETRIAMKSTINETRTERFLRSALVNGGDVVAALRDPSLPLPDITQLRPVPVYLNYYGAHTGRSSGSDKRNWQNLERTNKKNPKKGVLRKAALAPFGMKMTAADSGAIEARMTAWLAGHEELIEAFRNNKDVYSAFMTEVLGRPVDRKKNPEDEIPGFIGKICLAGETPTLTEHRGWVRLDQVCQTDRVWDGVEWVTHQGLLDQGVKEVVEFRGLAATSDHEVMVNKQWAEWGRVATDPFLFQSALHSVALPSCVGNTGKRREENGDSVPSLFVRVGAPLALPSKALETAHKLVRNVPSRTSTPESILSSPSSSPIPRFVKSFLSGLTAASIAAITLAAKRIRITAGGALPFFLRGESSESSFYGTSLLCPAGTLPGWNSTELTTTEVTNQTILGSSLPRTTSKIDAKCPSCNNASQVSKRKTRVYDLLSAGSRKRFCVLTSDGPIIVHNCVLGLGYQMGWPKLAENFLKGAMNGPSVKFGWDMAVQMGVDANKFVSDDWKMEKVNKMITRTPREELIVHCAVTEAIVKKWRQLNEPIVKLWGTMEHVIEAMMEDDADYTFGPNECLRVVRHAIVLPNGMRLRYPGLRYIDGYSYLGQYGKMRKSLYGGKLTENVVQALARIVVTDQMLHVKATTGEDPGLFTHDDLAYPIADDKVAMFNYHLQQTMKTTPDWAAGLPLSVEGGFNQSYGLCK